MNDKQKALALLDKMIGKLSEIEGHPQGIKKFQLRDMRSVTGVHVLITKHTTLTIKTVS